MKIRKSKDIQSCLLRKGFRLTSEKYHHQYYNLYIDGKKQHIYTYFSHGIKEYDKTLMGEIKKQLKFKDASKAEEFFDCTMSGEEYINMLRDNDEI
jgi:hypothetical protein